MVRILIVNGYETLGQGDAKLSNSIFSYQKIFFWKIVMK